MVDDTEIRAFQAVVWEHYRARGRHDLPWRQPDSDGRFDPYKILVSEVMLQQTQVARVIPKYQAFLHRFPSLETLAAAELGEVLQAWSGLGYNRRAKFLREAARCLVSDHGGRFPREPDELMKLPGIGAGTAGALLTYAFNQPVVFIETNIRSAFIYHFFQGQSNIADAEILQLASGALPQRESPREWYWALMDYGSFLKQTTGSLNMLSKHYARQSKFAGSRRQIRGQVIRLLGLRPLTYDQLAQEIPDPRLDEIVQALLDEGLINRQNRRLSL